MSTICRLISTNEKIPHQNISMGCSLTIGRNRECRIRDIKCSRNYCSISYNENQIICKYIKTGLTQNLSNGHLLTGPGFQYKIVIINNNNINNNNNSLWNFSP